MTFFYQYDIAALIIEAIVLFFYFQKKNIPSFQNKVFLLMVLILIVGTVFDLLTSLIESNHSKYSVDFIWLCECIYFTILNTLGMLFALYSVAVLELIPLFSKKKIHVFQYLLFVPYVIVFLVIWLSYFLDGHVELAFTVTEEFGYQRNYNIWYFLIYLLNLYYIISSFIIVLKYKKNTLKSKRRMLYAYVLVVLITVVMQLVKYGLLVECFGMATASLVFFIYIQRPEEYIDSITGSYNQIGFNGIVNYKISLENKFTCIVIILDDTVFMANTFGIDQMNKFLVEVALFLNGKFHRKNVFALNQGCFCVFLENPDDEILNKAINDIQLRFNNSWIYDSIELKLYSRLCIVECPDDATTTEEIIDIVDMISSDERYKQNIVFAKDIDMEYKRRTIYIEHTLRRGLMENRFDVYYQPIYSVYEGKVIGAEALIRLKDEKGRFISPEDFIPIAEKNGTILRIGEFVFESVCRTLSQINLKEYGIKKIDINLSVAQCMQELFSEQILAINSIYQIPASIINLEITETAAAHTPDILLRNVQSLANAGFELSLDDYGSGYSNMNYMLNLPFKMIKIDKYIVWAAFADQRAEKALAATIKMIKSIGMTVLAEGVEEKDQAEWLINLGCDYLQGYYYSKPVPKDEFLDIMKKNINS